MSTTKTLLTRIGDAAGFTAGLLNSRTYAFCSNGTNFRDSMIYVRRMQDTSISRCILRVDWTTGTPYTPYPAVSGNMIDSYVVSLIDGVYYGVYLCLDGSGNSTDDPAINIGFTTSPMQLSDGYRWILLYTLPVNSPLFFGASSLYFPVPATGSNFPVGGLYRIIVTDPQTFTTIPTIEIVGDGQGATAAVPASVYGGGSPTNTVVINGCPVYKSTNVSLPPVGSFSLTDLAITSVGSGYTTASVKVNGVVDNTIEVVFLPIIVNDLPGFLESTIVATNIRFDWNDSLLNGISFDKVGILLDPKTLSGQVLTDENDVVFYELNIQDSGSGFTGSSYTQGGTVLVGSLTGTVVNWKMSSPSDGIISVILPRNTVVLPSTVIDTFINITVLSATSPVVDNYSGALVELNTTSTLTKTEITSQTFTTFRIF